MDIYDAQNHGANLAAPKYDHSKEPMPSREELLARKSFGSPDNNPYMNRERHIHERIAEAQKLLRGVK